VVAVRHQIGVAAGTMVVLGADADGTVVVLGGSYVLTSWGCCYGCMVLLLLLVLFIQVCLGVCDVGAAVMALPCTCSPGCC
jgi:hypothetical protein